MSDTLPRYSLSSVLSLGRHFWGNSAKWLSCPATQSGMLDSSWLGAPKSSPSFVCDRSHCRSICCFPWESPHAPVLCSIPMDLINFWFVTFCLLCIALRQIGQQWGPRLRPGLVCTSFILLLPCVNVFNKGWYNHISQFFTVVSVLPKLQNAKLLISPQCKWLLNSSFLCHLP